MDPTRNKMLKQHLTYQKHGTKMSWQDKKSAKYHWHVKIRHGRPTTIWMTRSCPGLTEPMSRRTGIVSQRRACPMTHPTRRDLTGNTGKPANPGTLESNTSKTVQELTWMEDPNGTRIMRRNSCGDLNGEWGNIGENEWVPELRRREQLIKT